LRLNVSGKIFIIWVHFIQFKKIIQGKANCNFDILFHNFNNWKLLLCDFYSYSIHNIA